MRDGGGKNRTLTVYDCVSPVMAMKTAPATVEVNPCTQNPVGKHVQAYYDPLSTRMLTCGGTPSTQVTLTPTCTQTAEGTLEWKPVVHKSRAPVGQNHTSLTQSLRAGSVHRVNAEHLLTLQTRTA